MWWQLFIVLVATVGASDDDNEEHGPNCMSMMYHECEPEPGTAPDFPGNAEELEEVCKFASTYFECNDRVLSSCEEEPSDFSRILRETAALFNRVCNEDLVLKTAVGAMLPCFKENAMRLGSCDHSLSAFNEALNELGVAETEDLDHAQRRCLSFIYEMSCTAATTGLFCGDVARDIVINMILGFDAPFELCPAGVKDKIPEIAELIQIEAEKANSIENKLKRKK